MPIDRILFLDVDGVLCIRGQGGRLQSDLCTNLLNAISGLGVTIVLTSLWRHSEDRIKMLEEQGIKIHSATDDIEEEPRSREIAQWLDDHQPQISPTVRIAVLDDSSLANPLSLPDFKFKEATRFFQTLPHGTRSSDPGLTPRIAETIRGHLSAGLI